MQDAVEKFAIFGGVEWGKVDTSQDSFELIKKLILDDYRYIRNDITDLTGGAPLHHSILSAIAMGDGKTHSIYKRANVAEDVAQRAIDELCESKIIKYVKAQDKAVDDKLVFTTPFLKFWFAFVSPLFKGVRDGNYDEVEARWKNRENEFVSEIFASLSREMIKESLKDEKIMNISSFWSRETSADIYAKTKDKKVLFGTSSYANAKLKKSELNKLKEISQKENLDVDTYILVSKNGFSSELKSLKGDNLKLFTIKHFKVLLD